MNKTLYTAVLAALVFTGCGGEEPVTPSPTPKTVDPAVQVTVGEVLPAWQEGYLDIHSINSGRGECFYYILPDGTTMLVDCAGAPAMEIAKSEGVPSKPGVDIQSGKVIVDYIKHFAPEAAGGKIDYFMASHYHGDHIGAWRDNYGDYGWKLMGGTSPKSGAFLDNGLGAVGTEIPIVKVFDRGTWGDRPDAGYLDAFVNKTDDLAEMRYLIYTNFLDWSAKKNGTVRETIVPGSMDQIVLLHHPEDYTTFSVRSVAGGGNIWTGSGTEINTTYVPSTSEILKNKYRVNENIYSCCFLLKYGMFDYFAGGDIQYTGKSTHSWMDIELPISYTLKKVEVMKASHHGTANANSQDLLNVTRPEHVLVGVWNSVQPNPDTVKRFLKANSGTKFFLTNLTDANRTTLTNNGIDMSVFNATGGHIVVRVAPKGMKYWIYVLDDTNQQYKVKAVFGPYTVQ